MCRALALALRAGSRKGSARLAGCAPGEVGVSGSRLGLVFIGLAAEVFLA